MMKKTAVNNRTAAMSTPSRKSHPAQTNPSEDQRRHTEEMIREKESARRQQTVAITNSVRCS